MNKKFTIEIGFSTNPSVAGRYFLDLREGNRQVTTRTDDARSVRDFVEQVRRIARDQNSTVTVNDRTKELF